jgi:hypothetical protein
MPLIFFFLLQPPLPMLLLFLPCARGSMRYRHAVNMMDSHGVSSDAPSAIKACTAPCATQIEHSPYDFNRNNTASDPHKIPRARAE